MILSVIFVPLLSANGANLDLRNQILEREIERLTQERDTKYEALKKCESTTQGFKIAGITTLVATGVGVYGNIKLAQRLKGSGSGGGSGGGASARVVDNRPQEEKNDDSCQVLCSVGAAPEECSC